MKVSVFVWWWTSHQSTAHKSLRIFRFCILSRNDEGARADTACEEILAWFKSSPEYRTLDRIDGEPIEFKWNIFTGFTTLQLSHEVQELLLRLGETPEKFTGRIIFMLMFNDISWRTKDNKKECKSNAQLVSLFARRFGAGQWSFLPCPSPLSRGQLKSKGGGRPRHDCNFLSHSYFCKSAPSSRSSRRNAWIIWILSRGKTRCGRTVEFFIRAKRDQDKRVFE